MAKSIKESIKKMSKSVKKKKICIFIGVVLVLAAGACQEAEEEKTQSPTNQQAVQTQNTNPSKSDLLKPDEYNSEEARRLGYTVIHTDTSTSANDDRCGNGGGRYSRSGLSMCDMFTDTNDWYSASDAVSSSCPAGFVRVDQAGIGRESLAGSTRQCRTTSKVTTVDERAHYYCPHGSNLIGVRTGAAASTYGPCRMKCDPDTRQFYAQECGTSRVGVSAVTTTTVARPRITTTTRPIYTPPAYIPPTYTPPEPYVPSTPSVPPTAYIPTTTTTVAEPPNPPNNAYTPTTPNLPVLELDSAPNDASIHIVGIDTWFWIHPNEWQPVQEIQDQNGKAYEVTAVPENLSILISGPKDAEVDCQGDPSEPEFLATDEVLCSYVWTNAGTYTVKAKITWAVEWECGSDCEAGQLGTETILSNGITINVSEAQALVIS